jgi:hypothetical protein
VLSEILQKDYINIIFTKPGCTISYSDLALGFDVSSFGYDQLDTVVKVAEVLIANLHIDANETRVSLSKTENGVAETVFDFNSESSSVIPVMFRNIIKMDSCMSVYCSSGNQASLLNQMSDLMLISENDGRKKVAIMFTQAHFTEKEKSAIMTEAARLKDNGVILALVGVGKDANLDMMLQLATDSFFVFLVGEDVVTPVDVIRALVSTLEYDSCSDIQNYSIFDSNRR